MITTIPPQRTAPHATGSAVASSRSNWMLYGAYGVTGRKVLAEALRRGHRPVLAGRDAAQLIELGKATGLATVTLSLDDGAVLRSALAHVRAVLHTAGPFGETGSPMRAACLDAGCSYLDINGEIGDFGAALECDARARAAGVGIIPGVGYGVVFGESLAARVGKRLPDATWLRLSLATQVDGRSRAANLSMAAAITSGGREIREGNLRRRPLAAVNWRAPGGNAPGVNFASAPLGELLAAHRSTRIPNIAAGIPMPRGVGVAFRFAGPAIGKLLAWQSRRPGASRSSAPVPLAKVLESRIWAEAGNARGERAAALLETGEGYQAAAAAAVRAVEQQLEHSRVGALTPVEAFGAAFASLVPGTTITDL